MTASGEYQAADLDFRAGLEKFFGEGLWRDRDWPWKGARAPGLAAGLHEAVLGGDAGMIYANDILHDRDLPSSVTAERAVLGAHLVDALTASERARGLEARMLFLDSHRRIFRSIARLTEQGREVAYNSVADDLERHHELHERGGRLYLLDLFENQSHVFSRGSTSTPSGRRGNSASSCGSPIFSDDARSILRRNRTNFSGSLQAAVYNVMHEVSAIDDPHVGAYSDAVLERALDDTRSAMGFSFGNSALDGMTTQPQNAGSAYVYGFEIAFQQHFSYLPSFLANTGLSGNYGYSASRVDFPRQVILPDGSVNINRTGHPDLLRQAPHTWNISPTFDRRDLSLRPGLSYNAANIFAYNDSNDNAGPLVYGGGDAVTNTGYVANGGNLRGPNGDNYLYAHLQIDLQGSYNLPKGFTVVGYGLNLNNEVFGFCNEALSTRSSGSITNRHSAAAYAGHQDERVSPRRRRKLNSGALSVRSAPHEEIPWRP